MKRSIIGCSCLGENQRSLLKGTLSVSSGRNGVYLGPRFALGEANRELLRCQS